MFLPAEHALHPTITHSIPTDVKARNLSKQADEYGCLTQADGTLSCLPPSGRWRPSGAQSFMPGFVFSVCPGTQADHH